MIKYKNEVAEFCIRTDEMNKEIYAARNQNNPFRRLQQNFSGKIAELYINQHLGANDEKHIMTVYSKGTFKSDVYYNSIGISVKSQDQGSAEAFGKGRFTFGWNDPILKAKGDSAYVAGVYVSYKFSGAPKYEFSKWYNDITEINCELMFLTPSDIIRKAGMQPAISRFTRPDGKPSKYILDVKDIPVNHIFDHPAREVA